MEQEHIQIQNLMKRKKMEEEQIQMKRQNTTTWEWLPEVVIEQIQTLLSPAEAARSCVLSKACRRAWYTTPNLVFHQPRHGRDGICFQLLRNKFLRFVTDTLTRYEDNSLPVEKLDIQCETQDKELVFMINKWVRMALRCGSLRMLRVSDWPEQAEEVNFYPAMFLGNLFAGGMSKLGQSLASLKICYLKIHQESLLDIINGCPSVEKIVLHCCIGFNKLSLQNLPRLKQFEFAEEKGWEVTLNIINTPSLLSFSYSNKLSESVFTYINYRLFPHGVDASAVKKLKHLNLHEVSMDDWSLFAMISKLPSLEHLKLCCCNSLHIVRIECPTLKYVTVETCAETCAIREIHFHSPKLVQYIYFGSSHPYTSFGELEPIQIAIFPDNQELRGPFTCTCLFQDSPMEV